MKAKYLCFLAIFLLVFLLPYNASAAGVPSTLDDTINFKKGVLNLCLTIVNPSLKHYLLSFKEEPIHEGFFVYKQESEKYPHLHKEERLMKEITVLYSTLKARLRGKYKDLFHYNNVIQFGVLADLVIRYFGYELGEPVYIRWEGFVEIGDDPSPYLKSFGYQKKDINALVNAIANLWMNAWGETVSHMEAGYYFLDIPTKPKEKAIVTYSSTSGGVPSTGIPVETKKPCPKPYIRIIVPAVAKPGDKVEIRGRRFGTEEGEVIFSSDRKAKVVEWANTEIWVIVPRTATNGPVTVSVPCGSISNKEYFTVRK